MSDPGQSPEGGWAPIRPDAGTGTSTGAPNPWEQPAAPAGAAAHGDAPSPIWGDGPPPAHVPLAAAVPGGMGGGSGAKRIRPASVGRRAPSIGLVGGFGLLGLLITIAIMAVLANRVLSGTEGAAKVVTGSLPAEITPSTVPGATTVPGAEGGGLPAISDSADAAACGANRSTLELAAQAYELTTGTPPVDQQALVSAGLLDEPLSSFSLAGGPDGVQITGEGDCAGS